jgi:heme exporter protein A
MANSEQPIANSQQPIANGQQPTANNQQPTANGQQPPLASWFDPISEARATVCAERVCKAYGRVPVLFPLSFRLTAGQGLALLGANGSGKTTLLRIVAGVTRPSEGRVDFGIPGDDNEPGPARRIGLVGHDTYLYEDLTGYENLRFFLSVGGARVSDVDIGEALEAVGLRHAAQWRVRSMSAGMKRRLGMARLLLLQPDLLILDEPHASLDAGGQALIDDIVRAAKSRGRGIVIASHDQERALALCEQVIVLDSGRVAFQGSTAEWAARAPVWLVGGEQVR